VLWEVTTVSGVPGLLGVPGAADAITLLPSATSDPVVGEAAVVQSTTVTGDVTALTLAAPLSRIYDAGTVAVNANAVEATNGQTVQEILGSGDGSNDSLQFTLKQALLTYLPAPAGSGAQSTLQVWVNNLRWHETANLLASGPADRAFVTSANAAGYRVVQFGNGVQGARTPTGTSNIRAIYRTGIGSSGMVSAGQLSQPLDRPQGLASVTNPGAASGAADPASAGQAQASAPLPTLTIGRVVSLEDYQNYALAFAGISKALATWTWFGNVRGVFLTVAGANGTTLSSDDPTVTSLIGAIRLCGDPHVPLLVTSYLPLLFTFTASVAVDQADYAPDQVLAQVWQNVSAAFAFDQRQLGQNVAASDIIEIIQQTAGVIAVQLQALGRSGDAAAGPVPALLCASGPVPPQGAQMLLLDPATQGSIGLWS
jgi:predicted phage baseplate assembly protein